MDVRCKKGLISNKLTDMTVDRSPVTKEVQVHTVSAITDQTTDLEKG